MFITRFKNRRKHCRTLWFKVIALTILEKEINKKDSKEYSQNTENQEVLFKVDSKVFEKQKKMYWKCIEKKKTDKKNRIEKIKLSKKKK